MGMEHIWQEKIDAGGYMVGSQQYCADMNSSDSARANCEQSALAHMKYRQSKGFVCDGIKLQYSKKHAFASFVIMACP
jgi:hypothetical protein